MRHTILTSLVLAPSLALGLGLGEPTHYKDWSWFENSVGSYGEAPYVVLTKGPDQTFFGFTCRDYGDGYRLYAEINSLTKATGGVTTTTLDVRYSSGRTDTYNVVVYPSDTGNVRVVLGGSDKGLLVKELAKGSWIEFNFRHHGQDHWYRYSAMGATKSMLWMVDRCPTGVRSPFDPPTKKEDFDPRFFEGGA